MKYIIGLFAYAMLLDWLVGVNILAAVALVSITLVYVVKEG